MLIIDIKLSFIVIFKSQLKLSKFDVYIVLLFYKTVLVNSHIYLPLYVR